MSAGRTEPIAIDQVNKTAGTQVCGRYIGYAVVEIVKTENRNGALFMLAGVRFAEDGRLAWTASWVSPFFQRPRARHLTASLPPDAHGRRRCAILPAA